MNQCLKNAVYKKGTQRQVDLIAKLGGMDADETAVFQHIHEGWTDLTIQTELCMDRKTYDRIEENVRMKLAIAVFRCIDFTANNMPPDKI